MTDINKNTLLVALIVIFIIFIVWPHLELFNANTTEFVAAGGPRHGLRSDRLRRSSIDKYYIRPDRNVMLNHSGGVMYESNYTPKEEGMRGCKTAKCPTYTDEFDDMDTCWKCSGFKLGKWYIPPVHPHS